MDRIRKSIDDRRERTDSSLVAERASATVAAAKEIRTRRQFSNLIEHDRLIVDEQLFKFRDSADRLLASERFAAPLPDASVARERHAADQAMRGERETTDAILEQERQRSDDAITSRDRRDVERESATTQRHQTETDERLSRERHGVDDAVSAFDDAKQALSQAVIEKARNQDVLAMITHELRNPLAVILANAQFLADTVNAQTREAAVDVQLSAARMTRLLSDLLDGAHIDVGTFRIVPAEHDVGALLRGIRASYTPLFEARRLSFIVDASALPVPGLIAFDHDRIVQVLSNLLSNAMKFTQANGTVGLRTNWHADCVEFVVNDDGPGIAKNALPHVFERFWRAGTESREGLGLGLYICKTIVEAHGGRIGVESERGNGATFRFTLPAGQPASDAGAASSSSARVMSTR
jgi:signal transduction histidine kinase